MWDSFRVPYVEANPGANMNDVERDFLYIVLGALVQNSDHSFAPYSEEIKETQDLIEEIR